MTAVDPITLAIAKRVLTEVQFVTWIMAERGMPQRSIAAWRRVSPSTVRDCLAACDRAIAKAREDQDAA